MTRNAGTLPLRRSTRPGRDPVDGREAGATRVALVMVSGCERGDASLRVVQDFGRPEDGA